ncbi:RNA polymerase sigma factor SigX [Thermosediminibacter litoriperuensis]|uniref:RNA polymerase sigma factor (Sigma-70 family) n=1 Tax=Thermosediminibacter litoriperuensis TaxID=291989 RepID=A0A5S5AVG1_9FIRM|nr:RNA polymerase sigma factor SigX [Thermosediminibacter litoriperuensis]TYP56718.1 RNA polymerase sigma factor (sigma-70 family) [Thermosediminibacter litoriperuensis]
MFLDYVEVFTNYYSKVYKQLLYILNDPFLAEDLAQEVFLKFYRNPPEKEECIGAWLFQVAKNVAYNHIRDENNRIHREIKAYLLRGKEVISPPQAQEEQIYVRQVLKRMDERDRTILILKLSGYSYEEIAGVLGVKKTSVGTLIARAQRRFKELYEKGV